MVQQDVHQIGQNNHTQENGHKHHSRQESTWAIDAMPFRPVKVPVAPLLVRFGAGRVVDNDTP
eukprot:5721889-Prymnesium_polylepis.1